MGDKMKSLTFSQKFNCINNVIRHFTITIKQTYKQHCVIQILPDGGLPKNILDEFENGKISLEKMFHSSGKYKDTYHIHQNLYMPNPSLWLDIDLILYQ